MLFALPPLRYLPLCFSCAHSLVATRLVDRNANAWFERGMGSQSASQTYRVFRQQAWILTVEVPSFKNTNALHFFYSALLISALSTNALSTSAFTVCVK